jgi:hypothetical protein
MSRKYSHQGYQDTGSQERNNHRGPAPKSNLTKEERIQRRSLRHAMDREANEVIRCHVCGRGTQDFDVIRSDTNCPSCQAPLHCCRTCSHFDSAARWQCRAEIAEAVGDKTKANRCAQYVPRLVLDSTGRRSTMTSRGGGGGAREQFENLFKR